MNYINEQLCFLRFIRSHKLSAGEIALWHALFGASNSQGLGHDFSVSNKALQVDCGLGDTRFKEAKKGLVNAGLLICLPTKPRALAKYRLVSLEQLMNTLSNPKNFLPDSETDQTYDQMCDSPCDCESDYKSDRKSDRKSDPYINKKEEQEQTQKQEQEKEEKKEAYGAFHNVFLSSSEYDKLFSLSPKLPEYIQGLSLSLQSKGDSCQDGYQELLKKVKEEKRNFRHTG